MRIGYPCLNRTIGCTSSRTFRLASYSADRFRQTLAGNLACLERTLLYNQEKSFLFFRISSDIVPFASHPVLDVFWTGEFREQLLRIGRIIKGFSMRISMHPDQFNVLNSPRPEVVERTVSELLYHASFLRAADCGKDAKIQVHVGGVYGDKKSAMARFCKVYRRLPALVKERLVVENDERSYSLADCIELHRRTGVPVLFDSFHHACLSNGESMAEALRNSSLTWKEEDGPPMVDFSHQKMNASKGAHAETLKKQLFRDFLRDIEGVDCDIMLEIKDKETSAGKAIKILREDRTEYRSGFFS